MKKLHEHQDPQRFPNVMEPIEKHMVDTHIKGFKNLIISVTRAMVKQKK